MKRKLIKQGTGALTITLPKSWISKYELKSGDEVEVDEQEKTLLLKLDGKSDTLRKTEISIDNFDQVLIWRFFTSVYRLGYDEIILRFSDIEKDYDVELSSFGILERKIKMKTIEVIQDVVSRCIGMEIVNQGKNFCVIKDLGETSEKKFDDVLRRIFLLLLSMADDSLKESKENAKSLKSSISIIDNNVDKFTDFCLRLLNKKGYKDFRKISTIYAISLLLEFVGDEYKKIASHMSESRINKINSELINIYDKINKQLNLFYELFYKFEEKRIIEICKLDKQLITDINKLIPKLNNDEMRVIHHLKKIRRSMIDLLQLRIDFEV